MENHVISTRRAVFSSPQEKNRKIEKANLESYLRALDDRNEHELKTLYAEIAKFKATINAKRIKAGLPELG